jgi:hypothetical protein
MCYIGSIYIEEINSGQARLDVEDEVAAVLCSYVGSH